MVWSDDSYHGRVGHPRDPVDVLAHALGVDVVEGILPHLTPVQRAVADLIRVAPLQIRVRSLRSHTCFNLHQLSLYKRRGAL